MPVIGNSACHAPQHSHRVAVAIREGLHLPQHEVTVAYARISSRRAKNQLGHQEISTSNPALVSDRYIMSEMWPCWNDGARAFNLLLQAADSGVDCDATSRHLPLVFAYTRR